MSIKVLLIAGAVSAQCPVGEHYTFSGNSCAERKCCDTGVACPVQWDCPPKIDIRCECSPGYFRDANTGRCVIESQCTNPAQCGENQMWNLCGNSCREIECSRSSVGPVQKSHNTCSTNCEQRCECMPGFIRHYDGTCVSAHQCYSCGLNQTFKQCGSTCREPTCGMPSRSNWNCDNSCTPRCECDTGYVRDHLGNCVLETTCTNPFCPVNEEISECKTRCKCKDGYVRNSEGVCILPTSCPVKWCGWNEAWTTCGSAFCEGTCAQPDKGHLSCGSCEARCQCLPGYVRNEAGYCVPWSQCPPQDPCSTNEYYTQCGSSCHEPKCSCVQSYGYNCYAQRLSFKCPTVCEERCECIPGYVRDNALNSSSYGKCVAVNQCLPNPIVTTPETLTYIVTTTAQPTTGLNCGCNANMVAFSHIYNGTGTAVCTGYGRKGSKGSTWKLTCSNGKTLTTTMGKRCGLQQKLNCDLNAPAVDCGCHPTAIAQQYVTGGAGGKAECLSRGKKGSKGSIWKLTCTGKSTMKPAVSMGKNCQLQDSLWCGTGVPPVTYKCGCEVEVAFFKNVKCVGDNVYSCTGLYGETQTFSAKKCAKIHKKHKCAYNNDIVNPVAQPKQ